MTDKSDDSGEIRGDHKDITSDSEEAHVPSTSSATNAVEISAHTNTSSESGEPVQPNTSSNPDDFEKTADSNRSSVVDPLGTTKDVRTLSNSGEPVRTTESTISSESSQPGITNYISTSSDRHESERTNDSNISTNLNESERIDDSNRCSDSDEDTRPKDLKVAYGHKEPDLIKSVLAKEPKLGLIDRLLGCAYGQALGDAYGLSTEFETRDEVAQNYPDTSKIIPFPHYILTGHSRRWTRGDWTDDTDQWILILDTLVHNNGDEKVFAKKLLNWIQNGYRELGDHGGMGLGANVSQVVHSHGYLDEPLKASEKVWKQSNRQAAPNGAVMRCSASAFVHYKNIDKVISTATLMCKTTHFDPRCIASCLAVCLTIAYLLRGEGNGIDIEVLIKRVQDETINILGESFPDDQRDLFLWHTDRARTLEELNLDESQRIGYTYKCLASGFYGLRSTRSFEETLNDLIRYGGDADTNGAVCGTMYGARYGYQSLPRQWLRAMPFKKWFDKKLIECIEQMHVNDTGRMETK